MTDNLFFVFKHAGRVRLTSAAISQIARYDDSASGKAMYMVSAGERDYHEVESVRAIKLKPGIVTLDLDMVEQSPEALVESDRDQPMPTCSKCGAHHENVRPGKTQPTCLCEAYRQECDQHAETRRRLDEVRTRLREAVRRTHDADNADPPF